MVSKLARPKLAILRRSWLWAMVLLSTTAAFAQEPAKKPVGEEKVVSLTIDYADGVQKQFVAIPWKEKLTVLDVLEAAEKHPRGIKIKHRGSGATTLVTAIDDLENKGGGDSWLYEVNGKLADRSCGVFEVQPGDKLLWKFGNYR